MRTQEQEEGRVFLIRATRCRRCGGLLFSEQAVTDGIGACCKRKEQETERHRNEEAKIQYSLADYLRGET